MTTSPPAAHSLALRNPKLEQLLQFLSRETNGGHGAENNGEKDELTSFTDQLYRRAPEDFLRTRDIHTLGEIAVEVVNFYRSFIVSSEPVKFISKSFPETDERAKVTAFFSAVSDRPFVVDTISEFFRSENIRVRVFLHPIFRDRKGKRTAVSYIEIDVIEDSHRLREILGQLQQISQDGIAVTDDFTPMLVQAETVARHLETSTLLRHISENERREGADFLRWLADGGFVFLGYRQWLLAGKSDALLSADDQRIVQSANLGLFRAENPELIRELADTNHDATFLASGSSLLLFSKILTESTVHRRVRMDVVFLQLLGDSPGEKIIHCFLGIPTSKSISQEASSVPIIRRKLQRIIELEGAPPNSHDYKEIVSIVDSTPKSELLRHSIETLREDIHLIMGIQRRGETRIGLHLGPLRRFFDLLVVMPREKFSQPIRHRIQRYIENQFRLPEGSSEYRLAITDDPYIRIHFFVPNPSRSALETSVALLEEQIVALALSWEDNLFGLLLDLYGNSVATRLATYYHHAFPEDYRATTPPIEAAHDIVQLETLTIDNTLEVAAKATDLESQAELKLYKRGGGLTLSGIVPILENAGFEIITEKTTNLSANKAIWAAIYSLRVRPRRSNVLVTDISSPTVLSGLKSIFNGQSENDLLNSLHLDPGLDIKEVALVRTLQRYLWQIKAFGSPESIINAIVSNPNVTKVLVEYFKAKFNPEPLEPSQDRPAVLEALLAQFLASLKQVRELAHDRILRALLNVIDATVRTNYFQRLSDLPIGIKIDCQKILRMPSPRPLYEIYISAPEFEGIHLRGGKVARGGLRWSDRRDDYRTEVLGLMKTQMVKNSIIVPTGAKGGFVVKYLPTPQMSLSDAVKTCYRKFIRTLLSLTDNILEGGAVCHPKDVLRYDGDDPYLVVAADKGTATFSDIANEIAVTEFDFWLGDAFASGGSQGYDHKKLGITARGVWEAAERHFRDIGIDTDKQTFTVVGIGDMAGDVFGNGLLLSDKMKLIGAFNHKHIFVDPDPDPNLSFQERSRLFHLPGSQWSDYDCQLMSAGGGVFDRSAKEISVSKQAQVALGISQEICSGEELVRAILTAPVDLLWNGGIGTYVKSSQENHLAVGDRSNDDVRINANELRAKIVAEGGNLGFTQLARVEFAEAGGHINTDAVDNSGGVDLSDHEVNLKILLRGAVNRGALSTKERNQLLESVAEDVTKSVITRNRCQSEALSLVWRRSKAKLLLYPGLFTSLAQSVDLDRKGEFLPDDETIQKRSRMKVGLSRPELAIALAYVKMDVFETVINSSLCEEDFLQRYLFNYFPQSICRRFPADIQEHPLRAEIIATQVANTVVERMGATFFQRIGDEMGTSKVDILSAFLVAEAILKTDELSQALRIMDTAESATVYLKTLSGITMALDGMVRWLIEHRDRKLTWSQIVERYSSQLRDLLRRSTKVIPDTDLSQYQEFHRQLQMSGFSAELAHSVASLAYATPFLDIVDISVATSFDAADIANLYASLSSQLQVSRLLESAALLEPADRWEEQAIRTITTELRKIIGQITRSIMSETEAASLIAMNAYLASRSDILERYQADLGEFQKRTITISALLVLSNQLQALCETERHA